MRKYALPLLFLGGLLIRLTLMYLDFSFDINNHIVWGQDALARGLAGFYETPSSYAYGVPYPNYPPLSIYVFLFLQYVAYAVHSLLWWLNISVSFFPSKLMLFADTRTFLAGFYKLPSIAADLGMAYLVYLFAQRLGLGAKRLASVGILFILFNPAVFYNSAFWGQIDMVPLFFAMLAVYVMVYLKWPVVSGLLFTVGVLIKPTILVYVPFYAFFFVKHFGVRKSIRAFLASCIVFWISFLPFYKTGNILAFPFNTYMDKIMPTQSLQTVSNGAFNVWALLVGFGPTQDTESFLFGIPFRVLGYVLTALAIGIIFFMQKKKDAFSLLALLFLGSYAAFLFMTKMHERYLALPLIPLILLSLKEPRFFKWAALLSALLFFNLYRSWPVPMIPSLHARLDLDFVIRAISALSLASFLILMVKLRHKRKIS